MKKYIESDCGNYPDDWDLEIEDIADSPKGKRAHLKAMIISILVIIGLFIGFLKLINLL